MLLEDIVVDEKLTNLIQSKPLDNDAIIVGSSITKLLHPHIEWEVSDVDILIARDEDYENTRMVVKYRGLKWDIIQMCPDIPLIERAGEFDHSLVQLCFSSNDGLWLTPLASCTLQSHIVYITVTNDNIYYIGQTNRRSYAFPINYIQNFLQRHIKYCQTKRHFHQCPECSQKLCNDNDIMKWFERMRKYEKRFPSYKFIYLLTEIGDD